MAKKEALTTTEQRLIRRQMDQFKSTASQMMDASHQMAGAAHRSLQLNRGRRNRDIEFKELPPELMDDETK